MKKIKQWMRDHKKEIIVGVVAAGGTALYLRSKGKIKGVKAGIRLNFEFLDGEHDEEGFGFRHEKENVYVNFNMNKPGYTVGDLGKVGRELMKKLPTLKESDPINHLSANYSIIKK